MIATEQCPTCGRCPKDWAEREAAIKQGFKADGDRAALYRNYRRTLKGPPGAWDDLGCATDVDNVEWRYRDGGWQPAAVFELTRVDGDLELPESYFGNIAARFRTEVQGKIAKIVARRFDCKAWIVLFRYDCSEFWIYNLTDDRGWFHINADAYRSWLLQLEPGTSGDSSS